MNKKLVANELLKIAKNLISSGQDYKYYKFDGNECALEFFHYFGGKKEVVLSEINSSSSKVMHEMQEAIKTISSLYKIKNVRHDSECSAYAGQGSLSVYNTLFFDVTADSPDESVHLEKYLRSNKYSQR